MKIPLFVHCNNRLFLQVSCVQATCLHCCQSWEDLCSVVAEAWPCSAVFAGLASFAEAFDLASLAWTIKTYLKQDVKVNYHYQAKTLIHGTRLNASTFHTVKRVIHKYMYAAVVFHLACCLNTK